jgi:hypothetical protein
MQISSGIGGSRLILILSDRQECHPWRMNTPLLYERRSGFQGYFPDTERCKADPIDTATEK